MKKLALTTAIALALSTAAYAAGQHSMGGGNMGGGSGFSAPSAGGRAPPSAGFNSSPGGFSSMNKGSVYNQGNIQSYKQGGPYKQGNMQPYKQGGPGYQHAGRDNDFDHGRHLMNRADHDHDFDRDHNGEGGRDFGRHHGVVSGNFFEHGRHFRFRRFFGGEWVFLNAWDDCTAYAWVNVAPGAWAWAPVNICVG